MAQEGRDLKKRVVKRRVRADHPGMTFVLCLFLFFVMLISMAGDTSTEKQRRRNETTPKDG